VFAASSMLILLYDLYRVVTGRISDAELVMVKESEEQEELEELQKELSRHGEHPELGAAAPARKSE
jgi:hypothetical protein